MTILIVGGDGQLGRSLTRSLKARGEAVLSTTRRPDQAGGDRPLFDLAAIPEDWPPQVETVILCAARTSQQDCSDHPEATRIANVEAVRRIGTKLAKAGVFTLFLSTSLVFDGARPDMPDESPYRPTGSYGAQKAEAEQILRALFNPGDLAIVRLTKVLQADMPLLQGWRRSLSEGQPIHPFDDVLISPISLAFATEALSRIAEARIGGLFQISAADEITYADLARGLAERWQADQALVMPQSGRLTNPVMREAPPHGSLNAQRAATLLGLTPPTAADMMGDIV